MLKKEELSNDEKRICIDIINKFAPMQLFTQLSIYVIFKKRCSFSKSFNDFKEFLSKAVKYGPLMIYVRSRDNMIFYYYTENERNFGNPKKIKTSDIIEKIRDAIMDAQLPRKEIENKVKAPKRKFSAVFRVLCAFGFVVEQANDIYPKFMWNTNAELAVPLLKMEIQNSLYE